MLTYSQSTAEWTGLLLAFNCNTAATFTTALTSAWLDSKSAFACPGCAMDLVGGVFSRLGFMHRAESQEVQA